MPTITYACERCGEIVVKPKRKNGNQRFCSWNCLHGSDKGIKRPHTPEWESKRLEAIRKSNEGRIYPRGYKRTPEQREKFSVAQKKRFETQEERDKWKGDKNPAWRGGKRQESNRWRLRHSSDLRVWRIAVMERCKGKCVRCGATKSANGRSLDAHHIIPLQKTVKPAFSPWNGVMLCRECHKTTNSFAAMAGSGNRIFIEFVPKEFQEYDTAGNYKRVGDETYFIITDTGDETDNLLVLAHELCEYICVKAKGIPIPQIDAFDIAFQGDGEPGDDPKAPYKHEHSIATCVERLLCGYIGRDWTTYDQDVTANAKQS